jgi:hypothetical protein
VYTVPTIAVLDCHVGDSVLDAAGTWITAAAHVITAVIGSGVLSLAWALSTMGWIAGPLILFAFAFVTWYTSLLLADAYRYPKDVGKRNYTYPGAVEAILGMSLYFLQLHKLLCQIKDLLGNTALAVCTAAAYKHNAAPVVCNTTRISTQWR